MYFNFQLSMRTRILITLSAFFAVILMGSLVLIWYTYRMETIIKKDVQAQFASLRLGNDLQTALLNQRGNVSYYFMDGDEKWLKQLETDRMDFEEQLRRARQICDYEAEHHILKRVETEYAKYIEDKDHVIGLYMAGKREEGAKLHRDVREHFLKILSLCREHADLHNAAFTRAWAASRAEAARLRIVTASSILGLALISTLLSYLLIARVLNPIRKLAMQTDRAAGTASRASNEVTALADGVHGLMEDVDRTHRKLEEAESLASIGRMVAVVAHEIRNPLQSIRLGMDIIQTGSPSPKDSRELFDDIDHGIDALNTLVQDLLDYSKPVRLQKKPCVIDEVVRRSLKTLAYRTSNIAAHVDLDHGDKKISADIGKLTAVLVNVISNAADAMPEGGDLRIRSRLSNGKKAELLKLFVSDTGCGIEKENLEKIYEPFFTTKSKGTGLGIPICKKIIGAHGGSMNIVSEFGRGTTVEITLPLRND